MKHINIIETFMGVMDSNAELWIGYAKQVRSFEYKHIQRLHMEFMHETNSSNPDISKLTNLMKQICIYAHLSMLPDERRLELFKVNRVENKIARMEKEK